MTSPSAFLELPLGHGRAACLLGFALALLPANAAAQTSPIDLTWRAPPECPTKEAVLSRARALLGNKATKVERVQAEGTIRKSDERYVLTLLIDESGQVGERKVWARQCDELSGAAAIALVLLLTAGHDGAGAGADGTASGGATGTSDAQPAGTTPTPTPPPTTVPPPPEEPTAPDDDSERSWRFLASAPLLAVGTGPLPKPTLGIGAAVGLQGHAWSVRLFGQWFASQAVAAPIQPYGADVKRVAAGLWGCWDLQRVGWSFSPCLHGSVAHLSATGYGPYLQSSTQSHTTSAVGIGAIARLQPLDWFALTVSAGVQVELSRPVILLKTLGTVRQLAPLSAIVQLGPEWIF